jgi:DNA polymerase-3 subunit epsilon
MRFLDRFRRPTDRPITGAVNAGRAAATPQLTRPLAASPTALGRLAGGADRIVVVDCETTGVYPSDRVVEVALVTLSLDGEVVDTWDTLVQPDRDVGASHIHGLTAESLRDAPVFADIAGDLAVRLHGACVAAHNLPFDARMLVGEFERLGTDLSITTGIDTLRAVQARLTVACAEHGIPLDGAHCAVVDATATASLLMRVAQYCQPGGPAAAPTMLGRSGRVFRRADGAPVVIPDPPLIAGLAAALTHAGAESDTIAYLELVDRAVADLHFDREERAHLRRFANELGLDDARIAQAHRRFVNELIDAALDDHVVTEEELDALLRVSSALEVDQVLVERRTRPARSNSVQVTLRPGMSATFTGDDPTLERAALVALAKQLGLEVGKGVTKRTDLLIAHDAASSSGKAVKARSYNVPIITTAAFATAAPGATFEAVGFSVEALKVVTCPDCFATWTVPARAGKRSNQRCDDCAPLVRRSEASERDQGRPSKVAKPRPQQAVLEDLICESCGAVWTRTRTRGRKPKRCPDCSDADG